MSQSTSSESESAVAPSTASVSPPVQESYGARMLITLIACAALIVAAGLYSR